MQQTIDQISYTGTSRVEVIDPARLEAFDWIRMHTPRDAIFFADPFMNDFYVCAERARLVAYKNFPMTARATIEWYERILGPHASPPSWPWRLPPVIQIVNVSRPWRRRDQEGGTDLRFDTCACPCTCKPVSRREGGSPDRTVSKLEYIVYGLYKPDK